MKYELLTHTHYIEFARDVYENSFPKDERRDFALLEGIMKKENFWFNIILSDENNPIGIFSYWDFDSYFYIEHFAVNTIERNRGYGRSFLSNFVSGTNKPIVLEVELPTDEVSEKRIVFYKSLGFELIDKVYIQPPYSRDKDSLEMRIMTNNLDVFEKQSFEQIERDIHQRVYGVIAKK